MKKFLHSALFISFVFLLPVTGQAASFLIAVAQTVVACYGDSTGSVHITPAGGTAPYTYLWNDGATTPNRSGLYTGTYTVTITDNTGATSSVSVNVSQPSSPISTSKTITNVSCGGGNTGAIDLTVSGGTPGYTYNWNDGVTIEDITNLTAAVYYVTVTDANGCVKIDSANVTQPPGMVLTKTITNVTCASGANGAIDLTVQFGSPGYTYLWNDGVTTEDRTGIAAGNYSVTVTDAGGCTASLAATVNQTGGGMVVSGGTFAKEAG